MQLLALATPLAATALQRSPLLATAARPLLSTLYWGQVRLGGEGGEPHSGTGMEAEDSTLF